MNPWQIFWLEALQARFRQLLDACPAFPGPLNYRRREQQLLVLADNLPNLLADFAFPCCIHLSVACAHLSESEELLPTLARYLAPLLQDHGGLRLEHDGRWFHLYWQQTLPYTDLLNQELFNTAMLRLLSRVHYEIQPQLQNAVADIQQQVAEEEKDLQAIEAEFQN